MNKDELAVLKRIAEGHTLFTEYNDESEWKLAFALRERGLLEGQSLLTGTARFKVTEAGNKLLAVEAASPFNIEAAPGTVALAIHQSSMTLDEAIEQGHFED